MVNEIEYRRYVERMDGLIRDSLDEYECQPIFFVGSGMTRRYLSTPNWLELLKLVSTRVGVQEDEFAYLLQKTSKNPLALADELQQIAFEWAWKTKDSLFPKELFSATSEKEIFLKHIISDLVVGISDENFRAPLHNDELRLWSDTNPHAIITTNYDQLLQSVFDGYETIIGEKVIKYNLNMVGEIFQIHGSVTDPESIVITSEDYENYNIRKKYIAAKLITYLTEHPVFIFGYGFGDPNVTSILKDVSQILSQDGWIPNIFYVKWLRSLDDAPFLAEEHVIGEGDEQVRVRAIVTTDFSWIYKSIAQERFMNGINTKVLRALAARTYKLIRQDIPRRKVDVDYATLESIVADDKELPKLLGIVPSNNANMTHPYTITQVGQRLGFPGWHGARQLIEKVNKKDGVNICSSDNQYHVRVKTGEKSSTSKYSKSALELLTAVRDGERYRLRM